MSLLMELMKIKQKECLNNSTKMPKVKPKFRLLRKFLDVSCIKIITLQRPNFYNDLLE